MGFLELARRPGKVSRRDVPSPVPAGHRPKDVSRGTVGTVGTAEARGTIGTLPRDGDDIEERAGMAADCVPAIFLENWARLNCRKPLRIADSDWRRAPDDAGLFLDHWGEEAATLGWTAANLFDVASGLVWRLCDRRVEALARDWALLDDGRFLVRK